jgi:AAA domain
LSHGAPPPKSRRVNGGRDKSIDCQPARRGVADGANLGWSRNREFHAVRKRVQSALRCRLMPEYDPSTGTIPNWLAGDFHTDWAKVLQEGREPQLLWNPNGWYVRAKPVYERPSQSSNGHGGSRHGANGAARSVAGTGDANGAAARAKPQVTLRWWKPVDPLLIPPREWAYGRHYQIGLVSSTIGPGGMGKTSLGMVEAIAMATGRNLLGEQPDCRRRARRPCHEDRRAGGHGGPARPLRPRSTA